MISRIGHAAEEEPPPIHFSVVRPAPHRDGDLDPGRAAESQNQGLCATRSGPADAGFFVSRPPRVSRITELEASRPSKSRSYAGLPARLANAMPRTAEVGQPVRAMPAMDKWSVGELALTWLPSVLRWGHIADQGEALCFPMVGWLERRTLHASFQCCARKQSTAQGSSMNRTYHP